MNTGTLEGSNVDLAQQFTNVIVAQRGFQSSSRVITASDQMLLMVFLRGGCDGLSLVTPYDDPDYLTKRSDLAVSGALDINPQNATFASNLGLHPSAAPLKELYDQLDPRVFWQVHRGTIVNVRDIATTTRDLTGRVTLTMKRRAEEVAVSRAYAHLFKQM